MRVLAAMLCLILYGCGQNPRLGPVELEGSISQDTVFNVTSYGAIGDDNLDDTRAFRDAIAAPPFDGGVIQIPAGVYLLSASSEGVNRALDLSRLSNITIKGEGHDRTVLRMTGDSYTGDTHFILMDRATNIAIRDLALDGNRESVKYSDEQSHGVEILGSSNIVFERVMFTRMYGDGIRMVGAVQRGAPWVDGVRIEACRFQENGRSGITVQRGVRRLSIISSSFTRISDQAIDMEPTGSYPGSDIAPREIEIRDNQFSDTATLSITVTGPTGTDPARNIVVADNELDGTAVFVFNAHDVVIERNRIRSGMGWQPIEVRKASQNIRISENEIDGRGSQGASIELTFHTSAAPREVHIVDNVILSGANVGIHARDTEHLFIVGNHISGSGAQGVLIQDIFLGTPTETFVVQENELAGFRTGVNVFSREDPISGVCVRSNHFTDVQDSVAVQGPVELACSEAHE